MTGVDSTKPKRESVNYEDKAIEISQTKTQRKIRCVRVGNRTEQNTQELRRYQIIKHIRNWNPRSRGERENRIEEIFDEMMAKEFLKVPWVNLIISQV